MEYAAFTFGILGLIAFLELSSLKGKVKKLERELAQMRGTSFHDERTAAMKAAKSCIGHDVEIRFKEDQGDADVILYGNTRHGSSTVLGADDEWLRIRITSAKGTKEKLIRLESIAQIIMKAAK